MDLSKKLNKLDGVLRTFVIGAGTTFLVGLLAIFVYTVINTFGAGTLLIVAALYAIYLVGRAVQAAARHITI